MNDSSIARVVGVLFSPTRTFEVIRERPTWLVAVVVLVAVSMISGYFVVQKLDIEDVVRSSIGNSSRQLSEDQLEQAIAIQEKVIPVISIAGPVVFLPAACLLTALLFWVLLKMLGGEFSYKASFAATVHGLVPTGILALLGLPVVLSRSELGYEEVRSGSILASNLAVFASEETSNAMRTLLASFDVFSIWSVVLLTIGFGVVARVSRAKATAAVIGLWVVFILFKVGAAAISG
jgi:hypothetical protein